MNSDKRAASSGLRRPSVAAPKARTATLKFSARTDPAISASGRPPPISTNQCAASRSGRYQTPELSQASPRPHSSATRNCRRCTQRGDGLANDHGIPVHRTQDDGQRLGTAQPLRKLAEPPRDRLHQHIRARLEQRGERRLTHAEQILGK
ncbi:MAG: hypothetical protein M3325_13835 [Actinomycetota bacterium]|nr:hypothetical protein [Actinomycetota bacterium]